MEFSTIPTITDTEATLWDSSADGKSTQILYRDTSATLLVIDINDAINNQFERYQKFLTKLSEQDTTPNYKEKLEIVVTKMDTVDATQRDLAASNIKALLRDSQYSEQTPLHFASAQTGENIQKILTDILLHCKGREESKAIQQDLVAIQDIINKITNRNHNTSLKEQKQAALTALNNALPGLDLTSLRTLHDAISSARTNRESPFHYICQERHRFLHFFDPAKNKTSTWTKMLDAIACAIAEKNADITPVDRTDIAIIKARHTRCSAPFFSTPAQVAYYAARRSACSTRKVVSPFS